MKRLAEIATTFLALGATSYGGPAIQGIMQAELQEKRQWLTRERFVEGMSLVNLLPGATATQLGIYLGHVRGGWWGGLVAGLAFALPAFAIMLALAMVHAALGVTPLVRGALHGLGPVVLGIFLAAIYRLGRATVRTAAELAIAIAAALAVGVGLGVAGALLAAGGVGLLAFQPRRRPPGLALGAAMVLGALLVPLWWPVAPGGGAGLPHAAPAPSLAELAVFFLKVGAFMIGGGLPMIAFVQQQVVDEFHWLTPGQFIDGLALGQFTPGPVLMLAAYVGYTLAGVAGATISAVAAFLPSFLIVLAVLPLVDRLRKLTGMAAAMRGMGPAVIGVLAVSLWRLAPHGLPDLFSMVVFAASAVALLAWRRGPVQLMLAGAVAGVLRHRVLARPAATAVRELVGWVRP